MVYNLVAVASDASVCLQWERPASLGNINFPALNNAANAVQITSYSINVEPLILGAPANNERGENSGELAKTTQTQTSENETNKGSGIRARTRQEGKRNTRRKTRR